MKKTASITSALGRAAGIGFPFVGGLYAGGLLGGPVLRMLLKSPRRRGEEEQIDISQFPGLHQQKEKTASLKRIVEMVKKYPKTTAFAAGATLGAIDKGLTPRGRISPYARWIPGVGLVQEHLEAGEELQEAKHLKREAKKLKEDIARQKGIGKFSFDQAAAEEGIKFFRPLIKHRKAIGAGLGGLAALGLGKAIHEGFKQSPRGEKVEGAIHGGYGAAKGAIEEIPMGAAAGAIKTIIPLGMAAGALLRTDPELFGRIVDKGAPYILPLVFGGAALGGLRGAYTGGKKGFQEYLATDRPDFRLSDYIVPF